MKRKINKNVVFLTAYAILMLMFFLYARFPGKVMEDYILAAQAERYPGMFLSLGSVTLAFPPGLKLENISLSFKNNIEANIHLDSFAVRPRFFGYISGQPSFLVNARAYGGAINGVAPVSSRKGNSAKAEIMFEGLTLEKCAFLKDNLGRRIAGEIGGSIVYSDGGQLDFTARNGSYQLLESLFGLDKLDFNTVEGQISIRGGVLTINKLRLKGDKISCSIKGDVVLKDDIRNSEVNLSGAMEIASLKNKKVSMLITGTIGNAAIRYI